MSSNWPTGGDHDTTSSAADASGSEYRPHRTNGDAEDDTTYSIRPPPTPALDFDNLLSGRVNHDPDGDHENIDWGEPNTPVSSEGGPFKTRDDSIPISDSDI